MTSPITPTEAEKGKHVPLFVIAAFNELIQENFSGGVARVTQDEAVARIMEKWPSGATPYEGDNKERRQTIFERGYLNIEGLYEDVGWRVEFDGPGFNEQYTAFWQFSRRRERDE